MVELLTRPRGQTLCPEWLSGFDEPAPRRVDMAGIRRRQRERDRLYSDPPRIDPARFLTDPRYVVGLACPTGVLGGVKTDDQGRRRRTRFDPGAFDGLLWEVERGLRTVGLWRRHDPDRAIGTTEDGGFLRLFRGDRGLMIAVETDTARGQLVARMVRTRPEDCGELSIGVAELEFTETAQAGGIVVRDVHAADVREVSIVPRGSMPGTWIS